MSVSSQEPPTSRGGVGSPLALLPAHRRSSPPLHPRGSPPHHPSVSLGGEAVYHPYRRTPSSQRTSPAPPPPPPHSVAAKLSGVPCPATPTRYTAPVHIDVGGTIYTSSLETLSRFPDSHLARLFNGSIPIILDSLKQHYFIDRDGKAFRHVLNFLRSGCLVLPAGFSDWALLLAEARYYQIAPMCAELKQAEQAAKQAAVAAAQAQTHTSGVGTSGLGNFGLATSGFMSSCLATSGSLVLTSARTHELSSTTRNGLGGGVRIKQEEGEDGVAVAVGEVGADDVILLHVSPDLGERVSLSAARGSLLALFPELGGALMDARAAGWARDDSGYVLRFPLNGYCKLNSLQAAQRLLATGYCIVGSSGGGVEGQQFSEYLFYRKLPL